MQPLRVNDLLTERRLEEIESKVRREFPRLPDGAIFSTYIQPEGMTEKGGITIPVPAAAIVAILVPNPRWPEKQPQYRAVRAPRWLHHFHSYEKQRERLVDAPDVPLMDFRQAAAKAVEIDNYYRSLLN